MKSISIVLVGSFLLLFGTQSCHNGLQKLHHPSNGITLAFYNVENLYDTINDPTRNDEEHLPTAKISWNTKRYNDKLDNLGKVIAAMDTLDFPHLIGLAEIENAAVLKDLANNKYIKKADYNIVHIEGNDPRSIEVALLYRPAFFTPLHKTAMNFSLGDSIIPRHILYVKGKVASGDTLHVFVNHWTSRFRGKESTIKARMGSAAFLRTKVDSLMRTNVNSKIIIVGDLNDNPTDESLTISLKALDPVGKLQPASLYNLSLEPFSKGQGTLYFNSWDLFDQIIVSSALLSPLNGGLKAGQLEIIKKDWMLFKSNNGEARPNRTASGTRYFGGYSDHLPVMVRLK